MCVEVKGKLEEVSSPAPLPLRFLSSPEQVLLRGHPSEVLEGRPATLFLHQRHLLLGAAAPNQPDLLWKKRKREWVTHLGQGGSGEKEPRAREKTRAPGQRWTLAGVTVHQGHEIAPALQGAEGAGAGARSVLRMRTWDSCA